MKNNKILKLCIAMSLLVNLFLVGMMFGHMGRNFLSCKPRHVNLQELMAVLSQDKREALDAEVARSDHEIQMLRDQLQEERKKTIAIATAPAFNNDQYQAEIKAMADIHSQITRDVSDTISKIAQQGTDEQKKRIAEILNENLH